MDFSLRETNNYNFGNDPLLVSPAAYDFQLAAGSPAIDNGTDVGVTQDFSGMVLRPQGAGYDIGAYEAAE